ncbi:peptide deformylase [Streptomyces sp. NPDC001270]|uniref:peptide deformylase n=1 Tax=Streptomyces sp. NPDC001270 TaxID=3364554 RepID=UPI003692B146
MTGEAPTEELFIAELKRWRDVRGVSQSALAKAVGYTPSYVSKVESGQQRPSVSFADEADRFLRAGGAIRRSFADLEARGRNGGATPHAHKSDAQHGVAQPTSIVVEHEDSELFYDGRSYRATQRRKLYNASSDPIARYLIRISVDRHPGNPERSNQLYRENPLNWDELGLTASIAGESIGWRVQHDRDAFKEVWLLFENEYGRYPLYPGETAWLEYSYTVSDEKWGTWFQRAIRLPTNRLSVKLDFPTSLDPVVWGSETTMTAEAFPFRTAIQRDENGDRRVFSWSTDEPPLHARYRLEWKFRARPNTEETGSDMTPTSASQKMQSIGIIQEGDPILSRVARPFSLPEEAEDARRVVAELASAADRADTIHVFSKGMGVAAPQIGIDRAAAIVRTPSGETITLLNPHVIEESAQADEQYEGCWSFFDVRGMVPRPLSISVEHQDINGERHITLFEHGVARLVGHEIDHLEGVLYRKRMRPGVEPIPVAKYRGTGQGWQYRNGSASSTK